MINPKREDWNCKGTEKPNPSCGACERPHLRLQREVIPLWAAHTAQLRAAVDKLVEGDGVTARERARDHKHLKYPPRSVNGALRRQR